MIKEYEYRVYIIDLKKSVIKNRKFMEKNSGYRKGRPCVYVGSTAIDVEKRFQQHLNGIKANKFARKYGKRLRHNDMKEIQACKTRSSIVSKEFKVAEELRSKGWAAWCN